MLPLFRRITQRLFDDHLDNVRQAVRMEMRRVLPPLSPGARIAVTAGSRGIDSIPLILRSVCDELRAAGAQPFLVPAMGSHGGATAAGQVEILRSLGITEKTVNAPILASMDTVIVGRTEMGCPVHLDRRASEADGIVVVARIKPHTDFEGHWESGLAKMMAIGLGKKNGAATIHRLGARGLREQIPEVAKVTIRAAPVVAALAVLENALGQTWRVVGIEPHELFTREAALLAEVKSHSPRLPWSEADLLLVDYIGKDISGSGMDTRVIGRVRIAGEPEPDRPHIRCLAALDLTPASHGNAYGVGLADLTTERLVSKIDTGALRTNAIVSGFWERAKVPVALSSDRDVIGAALRFTGKPEKQARICRIRDTLHLQHMVVSESMLPELEGALEADAPYTLSFDTHGNLADHDSFPY